jgi:hypothetical protein
MLQLPYKFPSLNGSKSNNLLLLNACSYSASESGRQLGWLLADRQSPAWWKWNNWRDCLLTSFLGTLCSFEIYWSLFSSPSIQWMPGSGRLSSCTNLSYSQFIFPLSQNQLCTKNCFENMGPLSQISCT